MTPPDALASLVSAAGLGLLRVRHGLIVEANETASSLLGMVPQALVGTALRDAPWSARTLFSDLCDLHDQVVSAGAPVTVMVGQGRAQPADGSPGAVRLWGALAARAGDAAPQVLLCLAPPSQDPRAQQAALLGARAQVSLQRMLETAPMAMALFEWPSGRLQQMNLLAEEFLGADMATLLGRTPEQWIESLPVTQVAEPCASLMANLELAAEFPSGVRREVVRAAADGSSTRVWDMRLVSASAQEDSAQGQILLVATEVTDLRAAEQERFDAAIAQRGMLVQEVHHRIKNNLQGVAGLLQQASARFPEVAPILSDAVGQLQAIAQVYGLQVGSSGPVVLSGLLKAVAAAVQKTFHHPIEVRIEGAEPERWRLPEAEAIPVALTANELLTNAIKHGSKDPVTCRLRAAVADVTLEIVSRGVLRDGFDLAGVPSGASGLGLVRALLPRRAAEFTLVQDGAEVVARVLLRPPAVRKDG
ncbi:MAG: histidine kinase dimerization/phosphoacceptor domain -containing protein [Betaproteobacteria bacterium]